MRGTWSRIRRGARGAGARARVGVRRGATCAGVALALIGLSPEVACGQVGTAPAAAVGVPETPAQARSVAAFEAQRAVVLDLRVLTSPKPADYLVAARAMELLDAFEGPDAERLRRASAAAWAAGRADLVESATRKLVALDPADTVAQLRLISGSITRLQTVEERLAAYERYLGERGRALDASVRSRLAMDAALLFREQGDTGAFAERLAQAAALDPTNKDAAALIAQFYAQASGDRTAQIELLVNLLYADPNDPHVHSTIARMLAEEGAYLPARRFFQNSTAILKRSPGTTQSESGAFLLDWLVDGPESVMKVLEADLRAARDQADINLKRAEERDLPTETLTRPDDIRLPFDLDVSRALAASAVGDEKVVRAAMTDLSASIRQTFAEFNRAKGQGQRLDLLLGQFTRLQLLRGVTGVDIDQVPLDVEQFVKNNPNLSTLFAPLRLWELLWTQGPEAALESADLYGQLAATDLARAAALEKLGRTDEALPFYVRVARAQIGDPVGAWAATRARALGGPDVMLTDAGRRMEAFVSRVPSWLDRIAREPSSSLYLAVREDATSSPARRRLQIQVQNLAPIPLGFGSDRTISSRFLLSPALDEGVAGFAGRPQPEVVELDRRLRLMPRERLTVVVDADLGYTGHLLARQAHLSVRERWRVLQDFVLNTRDQTVAVGPGGLPAEGAASLRLGMPEARGTPEELAALVAQIDVARLPRALAAVRAGLLGYRGDDNAALASALAPALIERFRSASDVEQMLIISCVPHAQQVPGLAALDRLILDRVGTNELAPPVAAIALITRATDPDDPALSAAAESDDAALRDIAQGLRTRVSSSSEGYAQAGPSVEALEGQTLGRFANTLQ